MVTSGDSPHIHPLVNVPRFSVCVGKNKPKNMNVHLEPLVDELLILRIDGVEAYDAHRKEVFTLHTCMLWTLHGFPGYGVISSLQT